MAAPLRSSPGPAEPSPTRRPVQLTAHHGDAAGPDALGRNLVVRAGTAEVPAAWAGAARVVIEAATLHAPGPVLEQLRARWTARQRTVIELATAFDEPPVVTEHRPLWKVAPTFAFELDELWHLVWSNSLDARRVDPVWRWGAEAVALGARAGGAADVVLPDGTVAWCDGGPLRPPSVDTAVLHRVSIEHGSLRPLGPNHTLADLAPDQLAAVTHPGGPARIIAPAGSGKTRVLTERARLLLQGWGLPPGAVTLVAFNRRAAGEMVERTRDLPGLQVRTLNAIALAIVNGSAPFVRRGPQRKVIDERDVRRLLDGLVTVPRRTNTDPISSWIEALSAVRLGLRDPSEVELDFDGDVDGLAEVFPRYRELLTERGLLDFDEQIVAAIELLLGDPGARRAAQRACRLLLVDEFQDLTPAHLLLVRLLAGPDGAVFGVGDDDQTIYGYAGATPTWLIDYQRVFPAAGDHPLTTNYRCPPAVVEAAATLLTHNRRRVDKALAAAPGRPALPGELSVELVADPVATTVAVARQAIAQGRSPSQVAVITRVTASLAPIQLALAHDGVATTAAVDERWLDRTGLAAALAWLRLSLDPGRLAGRDLELAVRRPPRSLSAKVVSWIGEQRSVGGLRRLASRLSGRDGERIEVFAADIERLGALASGGATTAALLRTLRDDIGLDAAIGALDASRRRLDRSAQIDELDALVSIAELHPDPSGFEDWLRAELRQPGDPDGVVLNTIHAVKGREWPVVIVHDAAAGLMPHRLADDTEEERRVFHVGITRARERCVVVGPVGHPSPFVRQMEVAGDPNAPAPEPRRRKEAAPPAATLTTVTLDADGQRRAEALRAWRVDRAKSDRVPAYVVFSNATLEAIAARNPATLADLSRVSGVGATKLERYGDEVLAALAAIPAPTR